MALAQLWLAKAKFARTCNDHDEPWPAWSTGEVLAVAVILRDTAMLTRLGYTEVEALERLRHDIGKPDMDTAPPPIFKRDVGVLDSSSRCSNPVRSCTSIVDQ